MAAERAARPPPHLPDGVTVDAAALEPLIICCNERERAVRAWDRAVRYRAAAARVRALEVRP
jgi:hypothetical protein